jgi:hypothetical protein
VRTEVKKETQKQLPERIEQFTANEMSLAGATGLDPSSDLVKHFAKTYSEPKVHVD